MSPLPLPADVLHSLRPADHATRPGGALAFMHPSLSPLRPTMAARTARVLAAWTGLGCGAVLVAWAALMPAYAAPVGVLALVGCIAAGVLRAWIVLLSDAVDANARARNWFENVADRTVRGIDFNHHALCQQGVAVMRDPTPAMASTRLRLVLRLAEIERIDGSAYRIGGPDGHADTRKDRIAAIRAAVEEAFVDRARIQDETAQGLAASYAAAATIAGATVVPTAPRAVGSARINRLVENAEQALAIDPELVDAGGARVDALVREHLPRLLARHAELSLCAPLDGIGDADVRLEEGVELVRASVAEAIAGMRHARADALRTEIAFLRLRRGAEGDGR